jgi:hypothetical protein
VRVDGQLGVLEKVDGGDAGWRFWCGAGYFNSKEFA